MSGEMSPKIIRSRRKTLALTVTSDATLVVKAPWFTPTRMIHSFIEKHRGWIEKQQLLRRSMKQPVKQYQDGEIFTFLGIERHLQIGDFKEIKLEDNRIQFPQAMQFMAQKQLMQWYKKQAKNIITGQVNSYAAMMKTSYTGLTFSDTSSQWGSCTVENKLQFSWRLIMAPILVVNYVVVHELAHTFEKNHSRRFWEIVAKFCPSYKRQRKWLKEHGNSLVV